MGTVAGCETPYGSEVGDLRAQYKKAREYAATIASEIPRDLPDFTVHDITHADAPRETAGTICGPGVQADADGNKLLRELHAERAAAIPISAFGEYYLIQDRDLRDQYGELAGRIAASHGWDIDRVTEEFGTMKLGAPGTMNSAWTVDPLLLACIIRVADASHLDSRRAPGFLRALRRPEGMARSHWIFQERLQRPQVVDDRLVYTTTRPFTQDEHDAWWLCYDALSMVDRELRAVDAVLADAGRRRLAARSVARVDSPKRFAENIKVRDWYPIDGRVRVGDVIQLVKKLGGSELYGNDPHVPLRELIANAADAVRAKTALLRKKGYSPSGAHGDITVRIERVGADEWLSVRDTGIGMSPHVMTEALLSFGSWYWNPRTRGPTSRACCPPGSNRPGSTGSASSRCS
ncbi:ATP-binding protein [Kibdelosporangium phytohabitans]|uniref:HD-CE domain-containing protein n=1 Tax=Kibdelosporangium phytohabitans TaxID=860235 RepID=A0A0N9I397_9PSEU|nr:ATP-binding protein [Kibdelosporangium phytohabitans]ALG08976.1 hypothetical protein AOZ06_20490 [Kibdelosporangium phytohabitans]MBE1469852.1 hypothetical protein [Kibdelosporangium phytohabitans]